MVSNATTTELQKVSVVGLGYIGLPTAAFIASKGIEVVGVDVNPTYVQKVNAGKIPFFEPDFENLLKDVTQQGLLKASANQVEADAYIICVPTPFKEGHRMDGRFIQSAVEAMAPHLRPGALVVLESTSPPGTTEKMTEQILQLRPDLSVDEHAENAIYVAHCPETVLPGKIMEEMENNDRMIGGLNSRSTEIATALYRTFVTADILQTNARTAEMAKLTENSFRDVNIAFANELSLICDELDIDVWELIELSNHHPRVDILQPGPGVGGHCIAVDPWFIVSSAPEQARLIKLAREVNDSKPAFVIDKVHQSIADVENPTIAALGIAFKNDIDDLRESPSLDIVKRLAEESTETQIRVVEPNISELPGSLAKHENVVLEDLNSAIQKSDLVLLLVSHKQFVEMNTSVLDGKKVIDTKGIWR